jgi:hypothetical protein
MMLLFKPVAALHLTLRGKISKPACINFHNVALHKNNGFCALFDKKHSTGKNKIRHPRQVLTLYI